METFRANCVAIDDMEDFWLVGFADEQYDTEQYLMLQRSYEDDEQDVELGMATYYVERDAQGRSCYGGIERFELYRDQVIITFDQTGIKETVSEQQLVITFDIDEQTFNSLQDRLEKIFAGTTCLSMQHV